MARMKCLLCGKDPSIAELVSGRPHVCLPVWLARFSEESETEAVEVRAEDAEDAAEEFIRWYDSLDYTLTNDVCVTVKHPDTGEKKTFRVTGEMIASYHFAQVDNIADDSE